MELCEKVGVLDRIEEIKETFNWGKHEKERWEFSIKNPEVLSDEIKERILLLFGEDEKRQVHAYFCTILLDIFSRGLLRKFPWIEEIGQGGRFGEWLVIRGKSLEEFLSEERTIEELDALEIDLIDIQKSVDIFMSNISLILKIILFLEIPREVK
jgi:hypothetical protein